MVTGTEVTELTPRDGCPKHMAMGPCGGVRDGGGCEVITGPSARGYEYAAAIKAELAGRIREVHLPGGRVMTGNDSMAAEFDTMAEWTAEVALSLGPEYHIPAACRGSGHPPALGWLLAGLAPRPGDLLLDVGAGLGGPSAYAAEKAGVRPLLAEPAPDACRAAARLFGVPVVRADATALPFAGGVAGHAWCLGVLCTVGGPDAQLALLRELRRVLRPGHRLDNPPAGNHFPTPAGLAGLLRESGLETGDAVDPAALAPPSAAWQERTAAVEAELRRRFAGRPDLAVAEEQSGRIGELLRSGELVSGAIILRRPA